MGGVSGGAWRVPHNRQTQWAAQQTYFFLVQTRLGKDLLKQVDHHSLCLGWNRSVDRGQRLGHGGLVLGDVEEASSRSQQNRLPHREEVGILKNRGL